MAKRKYGMNEKKIEKYIKEGRGSGEKETYKPWIRIQDMSSTGRSNIFYTSFHYYYSLYFVIIF